MGLTCPKCKRQIHDEDAVYCPFCSSALRHREPRRTDFTIAGGVLLIVTAAICVITGMVALVIFVSTFGSTYNYGWTVRGFSCRLEDLLAGTVGIVAFIYGLAAGILALKQRNHNHCMAGGVLMVCEGFLVVLAFAYQWPSSWILGVVFGIPIIILAGVAVLFISISQREFR